MMAEHTPGPWGCRDTSYHAHDYRLTKPNGEPLPVNAPYNDHSEQRANARLIAAAPDLLEALEYLLEQTIVQDEQYDCIITEGEAEAAAMARAAIAKARGVSC